MGSREAKSTGGSLAVVRVNCARVWRMGLHPSRPPPVSVLSLSRHRPKGNFLFPLGGGPRQRSGRLGQPPRVLCARVAQLDRASASEAEGRGFESLLAHVVPLPSPFSLPSLPPSRCRFSATRSRQTSWTSPNSVASQFPTCSSWQKASVLRSPPACASRN